MTRLTILAEARRDLAETRAWYERRASGLGDDFLVVVDATLEAIRRSPEAHRAVIGSYRRALLKRFPYAVYYEFVEDEVVVYAVVHGSQDPGKWRERLP